ncbi:hypothetical protein PENSTE_c041G10147 [Penicillium steckii]|uniref:Uncharacterized protein n=1 Tax=Penicillium steckii TaxID=303698 RepID=A0A1V6SIX2_9EURO|nr:hypothetical protein PENSTE_c041G10147 [Penicillium steckii]
MFIGKERDRRSYTKLDFDRSKFSFEAFKKPQQK